MYRLSLPGRYKQLFSLRSLRDGLLWIASTFLSLLLCLLPRRGRPVRMKAIHEMHPMAYVDGIRGYAALTVYTCHMVQRKWKWLPDWIIAVPWLQWPTRQGQASVLLFFWTSAYVSMYKIVGLMQTGQTQQLLDNLTSLSFRRYPRLLLPIIPIMLITTLLVSAGVAIMPLTIAEDKPNANIMSNPLGYWLQDVVRLMDPFTKIVGYSDGGTGSKLLEHTWSLPSQFRSSMVLCLFCTATHKLSTSNRKILLWLAVITSLYWGAGWAAISWIGMLFAEWRQEQQGQMRDTRHSLAPKSTAQKSAALCLEDCSITEKIQSRLNNFERYRNWTLAIMCLYSFVYVQHPHHVPDKMSFPHKYINHFIPGHWPLATKMHIHLVIGCTMLVYPLDQIHALQRPLLTPFSQFLGELSFGIYAVHVTIKWIIWDPMYVPYVAKRCGDHWMDFFWCTFPGYFGMAICVLWAAEGFRRMDMQVVRLCKAMEDRLFEK